MIGESDIEKLILEALGRLNDELPDDRKIAPSMDLVLFGVDAELDSLSLISLIVDIESTLSSEHDLDISLADDRAINQPVSPFLTARTLLDYVMTLLGEIPA